MSFEYKYLKYKKKYLELKRIGEFIDLPLASVPVAPIAASQDIKLISWNIYGDIFISKSNPDINKQKRVLVYIKNKMPDILFIQESRVPLFKFDPTLTNYQHIAGCSGSINYNNTKFTQLGPPHILYFDHNFKSGNYNSSFYRTMMGIRLKNINNGETFVFINFWAPHGIKDNKNIQKFIIEILKNLKYETEDRIIFAGDFNEYYNSSDFSRPISINYRGTKNLYLEQLNNSCCGPKEKLKTTGNNHNYLEHRDLIDSASKPVDLVFDSANNTTTTVNTIETASDHYAIEAIIHPIVVAPALFI